MLMEMRKWIRIINSPSDIVLNSGMKIYKTGHKEEILKN